MEKYRISIGEPGAKSTRPDECCIIIDVLRASSTIVTALAHGVKEIIPATTITQALTWKRKRYVTAGERKGFKLPHFDLGNSPVELLKALHHHSIKKMVLTTSNLTRVITHCNRAYICSSLNLSAVVKHLKEGKVNIIAVGGPHGLTEDLGVALALLLMLKGARVQKELIRRMISHSLAAHYLTSIGYADDVKFITQVDKYTIVPLYQRGRVSVSNAFIH